VRRAADQGTTQYRVHAGEHSLRGRAAKEAFTLLSSGEVSGVFQVESQGMRRVLIDMKPSTFEHIVAMISLYRPGPLEYIPSIIRRMHGVEPVEYKHPMLEQSWLRPTGSWSIRNKSFRH
jgi:DNA polymerase III alpha subunit